MAFALPLITFVPMSKTSVLLVAGISSETILTFFSTGKISPVKTDSLTKRSLDSKITQSDGILSPADKTTMSPGTISSEGIFLLVLSRMTVDVILTISNSFFTAFVARCSWKNPNMLLMIIMTNMITELVESCKNNDNAAATRRIMIIGLLN